MFVSHASTHAKMAIAQTTYIPSVQALQKNTRRPSATSRAPRVRVQAALDQKTFSSQCKTAVLAAAAPMLVALAANTVVPPPALADSIAVPDSAMTVKRIAPKLTDDGLKMMYIYICIGFTLGCCWAGSLSDPFYDTEEYRGDGGDGTQHWFYRKAEEDAVQRRQDMYQRQLASKEDEEFDEFGPLVGK